MAVTCPLCTDTYYRRPRWGRMFSNGNPITVEQLESVRRAKLRPVPRKRVTRHTKGREYFCQGCGCTVRAG